jgi:hypothetical protein
VRRLTAGARLGAWLLVLIWALVIVVVMTQPGTEGLGRSRFRFDFSSAGHAAFFMILAVLMANALVTSGIRRRWWWAFVLTTLFGVATELLQGIAVPGRSPSMADVSADTVGAALGAWVHLALERLRGGATMREAVQSLTAPPQLPSRPPNLPRTMHPER